MLIGNTGLAASLELETFRNRGYIDFSHFFSRNEKN